MKRIIRETSCKVVEVKTKKQISVLDLVATLCFGWFVTFFLAYRCNSRILRRSSDIEAMLKSGALKRSSNMSIQLL